MLGEDEDEMAAGLMERGPLAVAINASWLQFYRKGISNPKICSPQNINHGVTMTGFGIGEKKGKDMAFWYVFMEHFAGVWREGAGGGQGREGRDGQDGGWLTD